GGSHRGAPGLADRRPGTRCHPGHTDHADLPVRGRHLDPARARRRGHRRLGTERVTDRPRRPGAEPAQPRRALASARPRGMTLLRVTDRGLYCEAGDFFVDPWTAVDRAVVTHAHGDHVAWGCRAYLTAEPGVPVLRQRLDPEARIRGTAYGAAVEIGGVRVSLHPAGHILGSAQVRIEHAGEVWVVSGDYKTEPDPTCAAWEPVRCHTFVTECTFGLPV